MRRDDLVLEYLQFYLEHPMRKHYVVTLNVATQSVLRAVLNPYCGSAAIEFLSVHRACLGWYDANENVALGCTFSFLPEQDYLADQLLWRVRHPNAATFVMMNDGNQLADRPRHLALGSYT